MSSVCPSVMLVDHDHIGWKSWKLIARTINTTSSLFVAQRSSTYSQGNMEKFWETRVGWEKVACWSTKVAISLKRVKLEEKLLWRAYRKSPTLFRFLGHFLRDDLINPVKMSVRTYVRPFIHTYVRTYVRPYVHNQTQCCHKPNSGIC